MRKAPGSITVVRAGWVVTVDPTDRVITDGAVAWRDGELVAIGPAAEVMAAVDAVEAVYLPGHVLLPGLVNAHTHLAMTMFRGIADDLDLQGFLDRVVPAEAELLDSTRVAVAVRAAAAESLLAGVTTALDMYFFPDAASAAAGEVGLRVLTGPVFLDAMGPEGRGQTGQLLWAEDWLGRHPTRVGWRPVVSPHGTYTVSPDHLVEIHALAQRHDALLHIHAAENRGEVELVESMHGRRPVELLDDLGVLGERTMVAHAVHLTGGEIDRLAATGTSVAHCPASNLKLASGIAPVPELLDAGVTVALGTDGPASSNDLDVFGAMRLAALLHKGLSGDARALPASRVLRMATASGAEALGIGDSVGSLELGKQADVVAVDLDRPHTQPVHDPVSSLVYAAGRGDVTHVWSGGRPVVADGVLLTVDEGEITAELRALGEEVAAVAYGRPGRPSR